MRLSLGLVGLLLVLLVVGLSLRLALRGMGASRAPVAAGAGAASATASASASASLAIIDAPAASQPVVQQLQRDLARALADGSRHTQEAEDADAAKH